MTLVTKGHKKKEDKNGRLQLVLQLFKQLPLPSYKLFKLEYEQLKIMDNTYNQGNNEYIRRT